MVKRIRPTRAPRQETTHHLRSVEMLEQRIVLSTITWDNLGPGDGLEAFEDPDTEASEADLARNVLWQSAVKWQQVIEDFNFAEEPDQDFDLILSLSFDSEDLSCGATANVTASTDDGKPLAGNVNLSFCDGWNNATPDGETDFFLDPTPAFSEEFLGTIRNAFTGRATTDGPADGKRDLLSLIVHEVGHVVGFAEILYDNLPAGVSITDTEQLNLRTTDVDDDTYWVFEGPSVNALMTNYDFQGSQETAKHAARPLSGNTAVNFGDVSVYGSRDTMLGNPVRDRTLISNRTALILKDAYGYDINLPEQFDNMYSIFDHSTGVLTVRGGRDNIDIDGLDQGDSDDVIEIVLVGNKIQVSVDVGDDVPGTGSGKNNQDQQDAFVAQFFLDQVSEVQVWADGGNDYIEVSNNVGVPIYLHGEGGNDQFVITENAGTAVYVYGEGGNDVLFPALFDDDSNMDIHYYGGADTDTLSVELDGDMTLTANGLCFGGDPGSCPSFNIEFHDVLSDPEDPASSVYTSVENVHLVGGPSANTLHSFGYEHTLLLEGEGGDDSLEVDHEAATLNGGDDNDTLRVGLGPNTLNGGNGFDTLYVNGTFKDDKNYSLDLTDTSLEVASILMFDGDDEVSVVAPVGIVLTVSGGSENDHLDMTGSQSGAEVHGGLGNDTILGSNQNDMLFGGPGVDSVFAGGGHDEINGGEDLDWLYGEAGNDLIIGEKGNDRLIGGFGIDTLFGDGGIDRLVGGRTDMAIDKSPDFLDGGDDEDTIAGDNAEIQGSGLVITVYEGGDDQILGGGGNDVIVGQGGDDSIQGNGGDDVISGHDGRDLIIGGSMICEVDPQQPPRNTPPRTAPPNDATPDRNLPLAVDSSSVNQSNSRLGRTSAVTQTRSEPNRQRDERREFESCFDDYREPPPPPDGDPNDPPPPGVIPSVPDGADTLYGNGHVDTVYGDNWSILFLHHAGGGAGDLMEGGGDTDLMFGQVGSDTIKGNAGNDILLGGFDGDNIDGGSEEDWLSGQSGDDIIDGGTEADALFGGTENDTMNGSGGEDTLLGDEGDDDLYGGTEADSLDGAGGADNLFGDDGNDTLCGGDGPDGLVGGNDQDVLKGEAGDDTLLGGNLGEPAEADDDFLFGGSDNDLLFGDSLVSLAEADDSAGGNDLLRGDGGVDTLFGQPGRDTLMGGAGNDDLRGGKGNDIIAGQDGDDNLEGNDGHDRMFGHSGADTLEGNAGNDQIVGGLGPDLMEGSSGNDRLVGGDLFGGDPSSDTMLGGSGRDIMRGDSGPLNASLVISAIGGSDKIHGGDGPDIIMAMAGNDVASGGRGNDTIDGGPNRDFLRGNSGNDVIRGGDFDDALRGDAGNDILLGEAGDDDLFGGGGRDILIGGRNADELNGDQGQDILIGGTTDHDANQKALQLILAEWKSTKSYANRTQNLRDIANPTFGQRLNKNVFLIPSGSQSTMQSDAVADLLTGAAQQDWFFPDTLDVLVDQVAGELVSVVP